MTKKFKKEQYDPDKKMRLVEEINDLTEENGYIGFDKSSSIHYSTMLPIAKSWAKEANLDLTTEDIENLIKDLDILYSGDVFRQLKIGIENLAKKNSRLDPKTSKEGKLAVCSKALHPEFT